MSSPELGEGGHGMQRQSLNPGLTQKSVELTSVNYCISKAVIHENQYSGKCCAENSVTVVMLLVCIFIQQVYVEHPLNAEHRAGCWVLPWKDRGHCLGD